MKNADGSFGPAAAAPAASKTGNIAANAPVRDISCGAPVAAAAAEDAADTPVPKRRRTDSESDLPTFGHLGGFGGGAAAADAQPAPIRVGNERDLQMSVELLGQPIDRHRVLEGTFGGVWPCAVKMGHEKEEAAILYSLDTEQRRARRDYVVGVWLVTAELLVMPRGIDMSIVVQDFVESSSGGVYLAAARDDALVFSKCILSGVAWMHAQQVLHLDIKPRNLLLQSHGRIVLCDFGNATRQLPGPDTWGTPGYRCPEYQASTAADVWSVGAVLQSMWTQALEPEVIYEPPACVRSAIPRCLEPDASKRPDLRAILEDDELLQVANKRRQHMCWPAEYRLRAASWYAYRVTFRGNLDPAFQLLTKILRDQILLRGRGEEHVADDEWAPPR